MSLQQLSHQKTTVDDTVIHIYIVIGEVWHIEGNKKWSKDSPLWSPSAR